MKITIQASFIFKWNFKVYDADGSGTLERDELVFFISRVYQSTVIPHWQCWKQPGIKIWIEYGIRLYHPTRNWSFTSVTSNLEIWILKFFLKHPDENFIFRLRICRKRKVYGRQRFCSARLISITRATSRRRSSWRSVWGTRTSSLSWGVSQRTRDFISLWNKQIFNFTWRFYHFYSLRLVLKKNLFYC